jgi:hypothetical protein
LTVHSCCSVMHSLPKSSVWRPSVSKKRDHHGLKTEAKKYYLERTHIFEEKLKCLVMLIESISNTLAVSVISYRKSYNRHKKPNAVVFDNETCLTSISGRAPISICAIPLFRLPILPIRPDFFILATSQVKHSFSFYKEA